MNLVKSFHGNIEASANVISELINVENISNNSTNKNPSRFTTDPTDILRIYCGSIILKCADDKKIFNLKSKIRI